MKMIYVSEAHRATDTVETDSASSLYSDYVSLHSQHAELIRVDSVIHPSGDRCLTASE